MILYKLSGYVEMFKAKNVDKDKSNKLILFRTDDEKLLEIFKTIWTNIKDLKKALPVNDDRYMKTEIRAKIIMPEDDIEWKSFAVISNDSLHAYEHKYYVQVYLHSAYKVVEKWMILL